MYIISEFNIRIIQDLKKHFIANRTIVILSDKETKAFNKNTVCFSVLESTINKMVANGKEIKGRILP